MGCTGNSFQGLVESAAAERGRSDRVIRIGDSCIIEINDRFFLLVEIEFDDFETVVVIRISRNTAIDLIRSGIRLCPVFDVLPTNISGKDAELECAFVVDNRVFLVFETERACERNERLFVVRVPLCPILRNDD